MTPKLVESTPFLTIELIALILAVVVAIALPGLVDANAIATPELIVAAWTVLFIGPTSVGTVLNAVATSNHGNAISILAPEFIRSAGQAVRLVFSPGTIPRTIAALAAT